MLTIDLEGRVTSWNATAAELFQWSWDEVMGKPLPIIPENERAAFNSLLGTIAGVIRRQAGNRSGCGRMVSSYL